MTRPRPGTFSNATLDRYPVLHHFWYQVLPEAFRVPPHDVAVLNRGQLIIKLSWEALAFEPVLCIELRYDPWSHDSRFTSTKTRSYTMWWTRGVEAGSGIDADLLLHLHTIGERRREY